MNTQRRSMKFAVGCVMMLATALLPVGLVAQDVQWQELGGPTGGDIRWISEGPNGDVFVVTSQRGLFRSSDGGGHWVQPKSIDTLRTISSFLVSPTGQMLLAADGHVYISHDDGVEWTLAPSTVDRSTSLAADSSGGLFAAVPYGGLYYSTDQGSTWARTGDSTLWEITALAVAPDGSLLAGIGLGRYSFGHPAGVMRSTDYGMTWDRLDTFQRLGKINAITTTKAGAILAPTGITGLIRSGDGGTRWTQLDTSVVGPTPGPPHADGNSIIVAAGSHGVLRSLDEGATWTALGDARQFNVIDVLVRRDGSILLATAGKGVVVSTDGGQTWQQRNEGLLNTFVIGLHSTRQGSLLAVVNGPTGDLLRSTDNGTTWSESPIAPPHPTYMLTATPNGAIYAVLSAATAGESLYRSDDDGLSWKHIGSELAGPRIAALVPGSSGSLYALHIDSRINRSTDGGTTWSRAFDTVGAERIRGIVVSDGYLYGINLWGVVRIPEAGGAWEQRGPRLPGYIYTIAATTNGTLLAATTQGLWRSTDRGGEWNAVHFTDAADSLVQNVFIGPRGAVLAWTSAEGVILSRDNGTTWTPVNNGLRDRSVHSFAINSSGIAYVGTGGWGVSRSTNAVSGVGLEPMRAGGAIESRTVPNPVSGTASLYLELPNASNVSVQLVDLLGRPASERTKVFLEVGRQEITLDLYGLASGTYFCCIEAGSSRICIPVTVVMTDR